MTTLEDLEPALLAEAAADRIDRGVVGALIHRGDEVLLLRRSPDDDFGGIDELPSGGVEPGESLTEALARELGEEIGWHGPVAGRYIGHFDYVTRSGKRARQWTIAIPYDGQPITLSTEHTGYDWATLDAVGRTRATLETRALIATWSATQLTS